MGHWWNTMPQYSALFDHHGRVRPAWYAFRLLGQLDGPRYAVEGEQDNLRAIAGAGDGYQHLIVWRYGGDGPADLEVQLDLAGVEGRNGRVVALDSSAPVNNIRVVHFGPADSFGNVRLKLKPWDIRWIEIE
jgi:hypothetical protein